MPQHKPIRGYAPVNGQRIHYEMHGAGEPLLLIHGEFGSGADFTAVLATLTRARQVVLVDMQGHGRTADIDRPLCFELLADDIAAVIRHLGFDSADLAGFSLGGCVALQAAIRNPRAVGRVVVASAPCASHGWRSAARAAMAGLDGAEPTRSPGYAGYQAVAPRPQDWPSLVAKTRTLLTYPFDWSDELARIEAPLLVVTAEDDIVEQDHADRLVQIVAAGPGASGARHLILAGAAREKMPAAPSLAEAIIRFLEEPVKTNP